MLINKYPELRNPNEYGQEFKDRYNEVDEEIFRLQLAHVNRYRRQYGIRNKHIIIGDVHDSLLSTFVPLIEGGIIEEGSVAFDTTLSSFTYKLTVNPDNNKVIYCGDVLGRGANRYAQCLLMCLLDLSMTHHDWVVFCFGNHEIMSYDFYRREYDDWDFPTRPKGKDTPSGKTFNNIMKEKMKAYYNAYPDALAYIFDGVGKSYIVSHTFPKAYMFERPFNERARFTDMKEFLENELKEHGENVHVRMSFDEFNKLHGFNHSTNELLDMYLNEQVDVEAGMNKNELKEKVLKDLNANKIEQGFGPRRSLAPWSVAPSTPLAPYYKSLNEDKTINREHLHAELRVNRNTSLVKEVNIFYDGRPEISDGSASIKDGGFYCYKTTNDNVDWFIGHTPAQDLDKDNRNLTATAAGSGKLVNFHLMDTNNSNNSGRDIEEECKSFTKYMTKGEYKYSVELLYLAVVDTATDTVEFYEWLEKNRELENVRIEYDEYMNATLGRKGEKREEKEREEKEREEERARRRSSGQEIRDRLAELRARSKK